MGGNRLIQQKRNDKFLLFLPLFLIELYLGMTLLLYQFGPIPWKTENKDVYKRQVEAQAK